MFWNKFLQQLAVTPLVRRMVETRFRGRARRRLAEFDHEPILRSQTRTLAQLVHHARSTRFGRDHDFGRIHSPEDYRRLVPVRTLFQLGSEYWSSPGVALDRTTWPRLPFAARYPRFSGPSNQIPLSPELLSGHGTAALTALGFIGTARPRAALFGGQILVLGKGAGVNPDKGGAATDSLESLAFAQLPPLLRPSIRGPLDLNGLADADADLLTADLLRAPVTCVAGSAARLARCFARVREVSGRDRVADAWPGLAAVLYARGYSQITPHQLREAVGRPEVLFLEFCFQPEGVIAVEDPRHGLLRLLPDHGVYFEFIPLPELDRPNPVRHHVGEVATGVPYAVALTSAGIWACLVDVRVCFERREPPLLRLVEKPARVETAEVNAAHPFPIQAPHVRVSPVFGEPLPLVRG